MEENLIRERIYEIRGNRIILDFDLATLYDVPTKRLNEQVKRNLKRFPEDFMFRLTKNEWNAFRDRTFGNWSQFATSSENKLKANAISENIRFRGDSYLPYAFTEHGVTMMASVLKSETAIRMNIAIVRAFVSLRQLLVNKKEVYEEINDIRIEVFTRLGEYDSQLSAIYDTIENLLEEKSIQKSWNERDRIGFVITENKNENK